MTNTGGTPADRVNPDVAELLMRSVDEIRGDMLHKGKAKIVYSTAIEDVLLMEFMDDATAFDGTKKGTITSKGFYNSHISASVMRHLEKCGVSTHFLGQLDDRYHLVRHLEMIPVEAVIRNIAAGSLSRRLGFDEGTKLDRPILEFFYKDDDLGDPWLNRYHIRAMDVCTDEELTTIEEDAWRINAMLRDFFADSDLVLIDFKLEFGRESDGSLVLGDEVSPDTCRLWDASTGHRMDKDRFRLDLGDVENAYQEVHRRIAWEE